MSNPHHQIQSTSARDERHSVTAPVAAGTQTHTPLPEYIRLPKSGTRCPFSGLSRSGLNALVLGSNPPVKSRCVKRRFAVRGVRLINLQSLLDFIEAQVDLPAEIAAPHQQFTAPR